METNKINNSFLESMARRVVAWGSTAAGILGLALAVNAALDGEYVGAGACLAASAWPMA